MVDCQGCESNPDKGDLFCRSCGDELPQDDSYLCDCGAEVRNEDNYCNQCGASFNEEDETCSCGALVEDGVNFCPSCGNPIVRESYDESDEETAKDYLEETGPSEDLFSPTSPSSLGQEQPIQQTEGSTFEQPFQEGPSLQMQQSQEQPFQEEPSLQMQQPQEQSSQVPLEQSQNSTLGDDSLEGQFPPSQPQEETLKEEKKPHYKLNPDGSYTFVKG